MRLLKELLNEEVEVVTDVKFTTETEQGIEESLYTIHGKLLDVSTNYVSVDTGSDLPVLVSRAKIVSVSGRRPEAVVMPDRGDLN